MFIFPFVIKIQCKLTKCEKKELNGIIILIIAKKVYNVLICRIGMGFTEDHESLVIKSHTSNYIEVVY